MKKLIIYAHPYGESYCKAILKTIENTYKDQELEFITVDLYKLNFNAILSTEDILGFKQNVINSDIKTQQKYILESDDITIIFPLWWGGVPAILKGYFDRVLSYGFAYSYSSDGLSIPLLKGQKVNVIITMGNDLKKYHQKGLDDSIKAILKFCVLEFCGLKLNKTIILDKISATSLDQRKAWLSEIATLYTKNR